MLRSKTQKLLYCSSHGKFCSISPIWFNSCAKILYRNSKEAFMKKDVLFLTGIEDFSTVIEKNAYYVDKTSYLKELLMSDSEVM
ncbi:MAG: AAA family ATPase, partial [Succinivibrio sp.]|nr:AAA family ATPase [Succinivibrio sp.]